jgi:hypothetical protein
MPKYPIRGRPISAGPYHPSALWPKYHKHFWMGGPVIFIGHFYIHYIHVIKLGKCYCACINTLSPLILHPRVRASALWSKYHEQFWMGGPVIFIGHFYIHWIQSIKLQEYYYTCLNSPSGVIQYPRVCTMPRPCDLSTTNIFEWEGQFFLHVIAVYLSSIYHVQCILAHAISACLAGALFCWTSSSTWLDQLFLLDSINAVFNTSCVF